MTLRLTSTMLVSSLLFLPEIIMASAGTQPLAEPGATTAPPAQSVAEVNDPADFQVPENVAQTPDAFSFEGTYASPWPASAAGAMSLNTSNTFPYLIPPTEPFEQGVYVWDAWPVRTPDGAVAEIDGWTVLVGLTAETDAGSDFQFYTRSTWRYYYTKDGTWTPGGVIFQRTEALGSRQWAGSTIYDPDTGRISFYYTAVGSLDAESLEADMPTRELGAGHPGAGRPNTTQRMAVVDAAVAAGANGISFSDFGEHRVILEADGEIYTTEEAFIPNNVIYNMRDPHYFRDPSNGREYILFTANAAGLPDPYNGAVGIAEKRDGTWVLQRPIIVAPGVSSQLERPHVVVREDGIYVFFSTHAFTYADGISGPEGLYGFYNASGDIHGHFTPMNGTGLVMGNPPESSVQTYSYLVLPDGKVMSYINTPYGYGSDPDSEREFFGAPGPLVQIGFQDGKSSLIAAPDTVIDATQ
ncbi:MAG: glycoside hydrolase family 68 protein [Pseudomonadota bacterium]